MYKSTIKTQEKVISKLEDLMESKLRSRGGSGDMVRVRAELTRVTKRNQELERSFLSGEHVDGGTSPSPPTPPAPRAPSSGRQPVGPSSTGLPPALRATLQFHPCETSRRRGDRATGRQGPAAVRGGPTTPDDHAHTRASLYYRRAGMAMRVKELEVQLRSAQAGGGGGGASDVETQAMAIKIQALEEQMIENAQKFARELSSLNMKRALASLASTALANCHLRKKPHHL